MTGGRNKLTPLNLKRMSTISQLIEQARPKMEDVVPEGAALFSNYQKPKTGGNQRATLCYKVDVDKKRVSEIDKEVGNLAIKTDEFVNAITLATLKYKTDLETNPEAVIQEKSVDELNQYAQE